MLTLKSAGPGRLLVATAVAALAVAGIAVADAGPATIAQVSATFYANTVVSSQSATCTGANNDAIQVTHERFTGAASSSDARLTGPVTVDVRSVVDTTTNLGWVGGDLRISTASPGGFHAHFTGVDVNGAVTGFLGGQGGGARLLGGFSGSFSTAGGFGSSTAPAAIGSGSPASTALLTSGGCAPGPDTHSSFHTDAKDVPQHPQHSPKHDHH